MNKSNEAKAMEIASKIAGAYGVDVEPLAEAALDMAQYKDVQFAIERLEIGKNLVCRMRESMKVLTHAAPFNKEINGKELKPVAVLEYAQSIIDEVEAFMEKGRNKQYEFMKGEEWK